MLHGTTVSKCFCTSLLEGKEEGGGRGKHMESREKERGVGNGNRGTRGGKEDRFVWLVPNISLCCTVHVHFGMSQARHFIWIVIRANGAGQTEAFHSLLT